MLCGVYPLMLELGRFKNIDEDKRVCLVCNKNKTENEEHFLTKCKGLPTVRKKHMSRFSQKDRKGNCSFHNMFELDNLKVLACMV